MARKKRSWIYYSRYIVKLKKSFYISSNAKAFCREEINLCEVGFVIEAKVSNILPSFPSIILWKFHFGKADLP